MKSHLTERCEHPSKDKFGRLMWCIACESGCYSCGIDTGFSDSGFCEQCEFEREVMRAEFMHDLAKESA